MGPDPSGPHRACPGLVWAQHLAGERQIRPFSPHPTPPTPGSSKKGPEHPAQPATLGLCSPPAAPTRCGFSGFSSPAFPSAIFPAAASLQPRQGRHGPAQ